MQITNVVSSWDPYLQYGQRQFYRQKDVIYRENEDGAEGFYYLHNGLIKKSTTVHTGESCTIDIVIEEKSFGEQAADGQSTFRLLLSSGIVSYIPFGMKR